MPAAILMIVAVISAATRLDATDWTLGLSIIPTVAFLGVIAGLALGQSRLSPRLVALFALAYGSYIIPWQLGITIERDLAWTEKWLIIGDRLTQVIDRLAERATVTDSIFFVLLMAICFWFLSVHSGYQLTRNGNAWWAIFPLGLTIVTIQSFDASAPRRFLLLVIYLFFALILVARMVYKRRQLEWIHKHVTLPPHLSLDFLRYAFFVVTIIVLLAWTVPALARAVPTVAKATLPLRQSWGELRERWKNAFASLSSSISLTGEVYGENISLGQGSRQSDTPLFIVQPPNNQPRGARYYWRGVVYDTYDDGQWYNTLFTRQNFNPDTSVLNLPTEEGRWQDTFKFTPYNYSFTVFSPAQPFWVSPISQAIMLENPDDTVDISGFRTNSVIRPQESYEVQSSIANPTEKQMREAGIEYPSWIKERYLNLPETVTPRTLQLAQDITQNLDTPYEKVVAVTDFLRDNYEYQEIIPRYPKDVEPIDWFLFDYKQGFCNYFASSQVVMLRAVGIPARLAVGYAQGELQEDGRYLVRRKDAHAWSEVYFPGIGWVEFEPTASQPEIVRVSGDSLDANGNPIPLEPLDENPDDIRRENLDRLRQQRDELSQNESKTNWFSLRTIAWAVVLAISGCIILLTWKFRRRINLSSIPIYLELVFLKINIQPPSLVQSWASQASLPPLSKAYLEINRALHRIGLDPSNNQTPAERAEILGQQLPATLLSVNNLLQEYQIDTFSKKSGNILKATLASHEIRKISKKIYLQKQLNRLRKPFQRRDNLSEHKDKTYL